MKRMEKDSLLFSEAALESPPPSVGKPARPLAARRVRFVSHPVTSAQIRRSFKLPRCCLAVEQVIDPAELPQQHTLPEPVETLHIVYVPPEASEEWESIGSKWLTPPDSESPQPVSISAYGDLVRWRPGRVVIEGTSGLRDEIVEGAIEFAFYEGEIRALEMSITECEAQAREDVPKSVLVRSRDSADWPRFHRIMERLANLRITCAALESKVERGSRALSRPARNVASRLLHAAGTKAALEGLDARLEVCEELYEGAIDRIADYNGWHKGHVLEVIIIALLLIEAGLMALELVLRLFGI